MSSHLIWAGINCLRQSSTPPLARLGQNVPIQDPQHISEEGEWHISTVALIFIKFGIADFVFLEVLQKAASSKVSLLSLIAECYHNMLQISFTF